jgi:hypothetical protein
MTEITYVRPALNTMSMEEANRKNIIKNEPFEPYKACLYLTWNGNQFGSKNSK